MSFQDKASDMFATVPPPSSTPFNLGSASGSSPVAASGWKPVQGVTPYLDPSSTQVNPVLTGGVISSPPTTSATTPTSSTPSVASPYSYTYTAGRPAATGAAQTWMGASGVSQPSMHTSSTYDPSVYGIGAPGVSQAQGMANRQMATNQAAGMPPWYQPSFANTPAPRAGYGGFGGDANSGGGGAGGSSW